MSKKLSSTKSKKTKLTKNTVIFGNFSAKFVKEIKQQYQDQLLTANASKNAKSYYISISDTYSWWYSARTPKTKFLCTSIILDYSLVNFAGLKYLTIYNSNFISSVHFYNPKSMQVFSYDTATQTQQKQYVFDPPLEFFDQSQTFQSPEIELVLGNDTTTLTKPTDYANVTLLGYEVPM